MKRRTWFSFLCRKYGRLRLMIPIDSSPYANWVEIGFGFWWKKHFD